MRIDGRTVASGSHLACDVCVVGAGVNGLLVAERLAANAISVCVIESGNEQAGTADSLDALRFESSGSPLEPTPANRARALGGTARIWNTFLENRPAARYFRMEQVDFERREGLPYSGWPFGVEALDLHYAQAEARLMPGFTRERQQRLERSHELGLDERRVITVAEGFGFAHEFTHELPEQLASKPHVQLLTDATVRAIEVDREGRRADSVVVTSAAGTFTVGFRALILAAGTIENSRLLLVSNDVEPAGLGNQHDLVGRFFMDHQRLNAGRLLPFDRGLFERSALFDLRAVAGQYWMGKLKLSQSLLRERGLLNSSTLLWPRPSAADDRGVFALKELMRLVRRAQLGKQARAHLREVLAARRYLFSTGPRLALRQRTLAPNITRGGWSHLPNNRQRFEHFELVQQIEQAPDPDNRVTLGDACDSYGVRLPRIHARFCQVDLESARESQRLLADELERAGVGRVELESDVAFPDLHQTGGIHHNLGGTRMHVDPKQGVVDPDARVHGKANLFVAGGSVFPTGGYANPTLTMAALSLRLADHVASTLERLPGVAAPAAGRT